MGWMGERQGEDQPGSAGLPESFLRPPAFGGHTTLKSAPHQPPRGNLCASGNGRWMMNDEARAVSFAGLHTNLSAQPKRHSFDNGETKSGASIAPSSPSVHSGEAFENPFAVFSVYPGPVVRDGKRHAVLVFAEFHGYFRAGDAACVLQEVPQRAPDQLRVASQGHWGNASYVDGHVRLLPDPLGFRIPCSVSVTRPPPVWAKAAALAFSKASPVIG